MNKELINKILPYCGHGLKAKYMDRDLQNMSTEYIVDVGVSTSGTNTICTERLCEISHDGTYHYKPILFPPDCLNREIETEYGKEIPLIEIAKIAYPFEWYKWGIKEYRAVYKVTSASVDTNGDIIVDRLISSDGFRVPVKTYNQWQLFQHLYSRHIAFNLDPEEYISVESLKKNPYAKEF